MKSFLSPFIVLLAVATLSAAPETRVFTGMITDTMCGAGHAAMGITPQSKCVRDCVGDGKTYKYALFDGKNVYTLSDQATPAKFAGQKVRITGQLYSKTGIIRVERIEAAK